MNEQTELTKLLKHFGACEEAVAWCADCDTASEAWQACLNPQWMLRALNAIGVEDALRAAVRNARGEAPLA